MAWQRQSQTECLFGETNKELRKYKYGIVRSRNHNMTHATCSTHASDLDSSNTSRVRLCRMQWCVVATPLFFLFHYPLIAANIHATKLDSLVDVSLEIAKNSQFVHIGLASATSQLDRNAWQRVATYKSGSKQTWHRIFFVWNHIEKA